MWRLRCRVNIGHWTLFPLNGSFPSFFTSFPLIQAQSFIEGNWYLPFLPCIPYSVYLYLDSFVNKIKVVEFPCKCRFMYTMSILKVEREGRIHLVYISSAFTAISNASFPWSLFPTAQYKPTTTPIKKVQKMINTA